jgi:CubicO group peptidase (beta-lactamase class C family)
MIDKITQRLNEAIEKKEINCAVCGVVDKEKIFETIALGKAGVGSKYEFKVSSNTTFDVASVTKTIPLSTLALIALDRGLIKLDDRVSDIIEEFRSPQKNDIKIIHLLTQTLSYDFSMSSLKDFSAENIWEKVMTASLNKVPGEHYFYCNTTSLILGRVIEKVFGDTLDNIAKKEIFLPLQMNNSIFKPTSKENIVPTEIDNWRKREIVGEVHDESSWKLSKIMTPGAAGLFTTVPDIQKYISMIINGGTLLFSDNFLENIAIKNYLPTNLNQETALGFELNQPYMGKFRSSLTIGKTGFTGSVFIIDFERKRGFTLLTDFTWPHRKKSKNGIIELRRDISDIIWKAQ